MKNLKYVFSCLVCKSEFKANQPTQKLCSEKCRLEFYGRRGRMHIETASVGSVSEMAVCIEMLKRGYSVFRTVSQASFCDVIAVKDKEILLMEVRTGYEDMNGNVSFPKILHTRIAIPTHFAVYIPENNKILLREITEKEKEKYI